MRTLLIVCLLLFSAATSAQQMRSEGVQDVVLACVLAVQPVQVQARRTNTGQSLGRQAGYQIAREAAAGDYFLGQLGATIGQSIGRGVQDKISHRGVEILILDRNGRTLSVIQRGNTSVRPGDVVAIVGRGQQARVVPVGDR